MSTLPVSGGGFSPLAGRPFVSPVFDYLLIGGGLSLLGIGAILVSGGVNATLDWTAVPYIVMFANFAHFGASTVRLYSKPGAFEAMPHLTRTFPLITLLVLTACLLLAGSLGSHLQALYLTWSPYHYAAQAYGLAVVYSFRSGCKLGGLDKRLLYWTAMLPFLHVFVRGDGIGLGWLLPDGWLSGPIASQVMHHGTTVLLVVATAAPVALFVKISRGKQGQMPVLAMLPIVANGFWWLLFSPLQAFLWATVAHSIQYLAIVIVFHVKDQAAVPGNRHGTAYHALWFYALSLGLGYALFRIVPLGYQAAGFGLVESLLLVAAAINVHHFVVDAFIWRLKKTDRNRQITEGAVPVPIA